MLAFRRRVPGAFGRAVTLLLMPTDFSIPAPPEQSAGHPRPTATCPRRAGQWLRWARVPRRITRWIELERQLPTSRSRLTVARLLAPASSTLLPAQVRGAALPRTRTGPLALLRCVADKVDDRRQVIVVKLVPRPTYTGHAGLSDLHVASAQPLRFARQPPAGS